MITRASFRKKLIQYVTNDLLERSYIPKFLALLNEPKAYSRELLTGHITASAWVISDDRKKVLLIHHKKLDRWLQPGGHADGNEDLASVAEKELREETGLVTYDRIANNFFDLDIHTIPERKGIPAHEHYDVRFLFIASEDQDFMMNMEVKDIQWVPYSNIPREESLQRMVTKSKKILNR